jgi:hypothetical protein
MKTTTNLSSYSMKTEFIKYMEVSGGIGQPKGHHQILIVTIMGGESSLWDTFIMDLNLMVARAKVNL